MNELLKKALFDDPENEGYCKYLLVGMAGYDNFEPECLLTERPLEWHKCKRNFIHKFCPFISNENELIARKKFVDDHAVIETKENRFNELLKLRDNQ